MSDNKITSCTFGVCCKMCVMCSFALLHSLSPHSFLPTTSFWSMSRFNAASTHTWSVSCLIFYFMSSLRTQFVVQMREWRDENMHEQLCMAFSLAVSHSSFLHDLNALRRPSKDFWKNSTSKEMCKHKKYEPNKSRQRGEWRGCGDGELWVGLKSWKHLEAVRVTIFL